MKTEKSLNQFILGGLIFFLLGGISATALARPPYGETYSRYPMPHDFEKILAQKFPLFGSYIYEQFPNGNNNCLMQGITPLLGAINPATGDVVFNNPPPEFVKWFGNCLRAYVESDFKSVTQASDLAWNRKPDLDRFLPPQVIEAFKKEAAAAVPKGSDPTAFENARASTNPKIILEKKWVDIPEALKQAVTSGLVDYMVGPGVLPDQSAFETRMRFVANVEGDSQTTVGKAIKELLFTIGMTDEFLRSSAE